MQCFSSVHSNGLATFVIRYTMAKGYSDITDPKRMVLSNTPQRPLPLQHHCFFFVISSPQTSDNLLKPSVNPRPYAHLLPSRPRDPVFGNRPASVSLSGCVPAPGPLHGGIKCQGFP